MDADTYLAEAFAHHRDGRLGHAEAIYRRLLAVNPRHAEALHHLGLIAAAQGRLDEAHALMRDAEALAPAQPAWRLNHGKIAGLRGDYAEAERLFASIPSDDARGVDAAVALARVLLQLGRADEARDRLRDVERAAGGRPDYLVAVAFAEQACGDHDAAERATRDAVRRAPRWVEGQVALGTVLRLQGRGDEAEAAYRQALAIDPNNVDALIELGTLCNGLYRPDEAVALFERALVLRPDDRQVQFGHATALISAGRTLDGRGRLDELIRGNPRDWRARWARLLSFPKAYADDDEIRRERSRFSDDLAELADDVERHLETDLPAILDAVSSATDFYLHYTGGDVRDLQARYGRLITCVAEAAYPRHVAVEPRRAGDRVRVGFASSNLHRHSVMKSHGCWISDLPRDRFEVVVFRLGGRTDDWTERLRHGVRWIDCAGLGQKDLIGRIASEELDALIWLDIGMDALVQVPAALRLAPVQVTGFGHPVTSGLPAIDAWLTGGVMEPREGERHYTERLVRLPNLSVAYPWPDRTPGALPDELRALKSAGRPVFLCAQSLFKLLPVQDDAIARIASAVPDAVFVFIAHTAPAVTDVVRERLSRALAAVGLAADDRIFFLPRLSEEQFLAVNRTADVVLDSLGWSGFNSTLEALAMGTPVVTMPGETMRANHTCGILTMAGLTELIAPDLDGYVDLAVQLGRDAEFRSAMRARVAQRACRAFDDPTPVAALADWIEGAVASARSAADSRA